MIHFEPYTPDTGQIYTKNTNLGYGRRLKKAKFMTAADATVSFETAGGDTVSSMPVLKNIEHDVEVTKITASDQTIYITHDGVIQDTGVETAPGTQASAITFSAVGATTITVSCTAGSGIGRVIVARASGAVNSNTVDKTTYTGNAAFGSGTQIGTGNYVVYAGSGTSVAVTGLTTATTYHFRVYEYRGVAGEETYNTATASNNPRSQATS